MRYANISRANLNLLVSFQVFMEERSVTAAARRMFLSQPAMSRVLEKLRQLFNDPLLVRSGHGYEPTRRAEHLYRQIEKLLPQVEALITEDKFDPGHSPDHFRISMTDNVAPSVLPKLTERVMRLSQNIDLEVTSWKEDVFQKLVTNTLDLVIWVYEAPYPLKSEKLYSDEFVCLVRGGHPIRKKTLTVDEYLRMDHLIVSLSGSRQARLDTDLNKLGYARRAKLTIPYFGAAASVIERTDLIATLPRRLARLAQHVGSPSKLRILPMPIRLPPIEYIQIWHPRNDRNLPHQWLRQLVHEVSATE